jgi:hypothetical protein
VPLPHLREQLRELFRTKLCQTAGQNCRARESVGKPALWRGSAEGKLQKRSLTRCASRSARTLPALPPVGRGTGEKAGAVPRREGGRRVGAAEAHSPVESEQATSPATPYKSERGASMIDGDLDSSGAPSLTLLLLRLTGHDVEESELRPGRLHGRPGQVNDGAGWPAQATGEAVGAGGGGRGRPAHPRRGVGEEWG